MPYPDTTPEGMQAMQGMQGMQGGGDRTLALIGNMANVSAMEKQQAQAQAYSDALRKNLATPTSGRSYANLARGVLDGLKVGYDRYKQPERDAAMDIAQRKNTQLIANALMRGQPQAPQPAPNVIQQPQPEPY